MFGLVADALEKQQRKAKKRKNPFAQYLERDAKNTTIIIKNGNHFLNARLENYLLVSDPTYIFKKRAKKKATAAVAVVVVVVDLSNVRSRDSTKAACTQHKWRFTNLLHTNSDAFFSLLFLMF